MEQSRRSTSPLSSASSSSPGRGIRPARSNTSSTIPLSDDGGGSDREGREEQDESDLTDDEDEIEDPVKENGGAELDGGGELLNGGNFDTDNRMAKSRNSSTSLSPPPLSEPSRLRALPISPAGQLNNIIDTEILMDERVQDILGQPSNPAGILEQLDLEADLLETEETREDIDRITGAEGVEFLTEEPNHLVIPGETDLDVTQDLPEELPTVVMESVDSPVEVAPYARHSNHAILSHSQPPTAQAIRSLLALEVKLAALRDRLYLERMQEAAREEEMIHNGSHPALNFLRDTLASRREAMHELASRRQQEALHELKRVRTSEENGVWTWWTDERDRLHWDEFENTWSKRRRLAREKNELETPKLAKPVPRVGSRHVRSFDWSAGASPSKLGMTDALHDLAVMENRRLTHASRHASPAVFAPQGYVAQHGPPTNATLGKTPSFGSFNHGHSVPPHASHLTAKPRSPPRQTTSGILGSTLGARSPFVPNEVPAFKV